MMRIRNAMISAVCGASAFAFAGVAYAGTVANGTYTGTSADGNGVSFTVSVDGNGVQAVTAVSIGATLTCANGMSVGIGSGYGQDAPLKGDKVGWDESYIYLWEKVSATFSGSTMTGTIYSETPAIVPVTKGVPKKTVLCKSPTQSFTATLTSGTLQKPAAKSPAVYSQHF